MSPYLQDSGGGGGGGGEEGVTTGCVGEPVACSGRTGQCLVVSHGGAQLHMHHSGAGVGRTLAGTEQASNLGTRTVIADLAQNIRTARLKNGTVKYQRGENRVRNHLRIKCADFSFL